MTLHTTDYNALNRYSTASIPVTGTGMSLAYNCRRMLGRDDARKLEVSLTGDEVPDEMVGIEVQVEVAGQVDLTSYDDPSPNLVHEFVWDGRDRYGNPTHGTHPVDVQIDYLWQGNYGVPEQEGNSFALNPDSTSQVQSRALGSTSVDVDGRSSGLSLSVLDYRRVGFGGWSLTANHRYDSNQGILYRGDGRSREVRTSLLKPPISVAAGKDPDERLDNPAGITLGADESVYVADRGSDAIRQFNQNGSSTTLLDTPPTLIEGSDPRQTRATDARLRAPFCAREGPEGSIYVADTDRHIVRRLDPDGTVELVVGEVVSPGFQAEAVSTPEAKLRNPTGLAFDDDGALLVADSNNDAIRRVVPDGQTTVVAGTGNSGYEGDGGPATEARLSRPSWIVAGPDGGFYVADADNHAIRRFEVGGDIETVVGGNGAGNPGEGDGGPATEAKLSNPLAVDVTANGAIYVACSDTHTVRRVAPDGTIETFAGGNGSGYTGSGGPATDAQLQRPSGVVAADDGSVYVSEGGNDVVRRVTPDGTIEFFNGWRPEDERTGVDERGLLGDEAGSIVSLDVGPDGSFYFAAGTGSGPGIYRVSPDKTGERIAGGNGRGYSGDGGPATEASFQQIEDIQYENGEIYVVDGFAHVVRKVDESGQITTVAGTGQSSTEGVHGDGGPATEADLSRPVSVAVGPNGELYIAEAGNSVVRRVDTTGQITTHLNLRRTSQEESNDLAGKLSEVNGLSLRTLALDDDETLYVAGDTEEYGYTVGAERSDGAVRYATAQFDPDEGEQAPMRFPDPYEVTVASDGTFFLTTGHDVYRVTTADRVSRVAGVGKSSTVGDERTAEQAGLVLPGPLDIGPTGQLYFVEQLTNVIRRIDVRLTGEARTIIPDRDGTEFYEFDTSGYHTKTYDAETGAVVRTFSYDGDGLLTDTTDVDGETTTIERDDGGNPTAIVAPNGQRTELAVDRNGYLESVTDPGGNETALSYVDDGLLSEYEAPSGRTVEFGYDDVGKLDSVTTAAGTTTLAETVTDEVNTVTEERPLGRTTEHRIEDGDDVVLETTRPSGAINRIVRRQGGGVDRTYPSGDEISQAPRRDDPRFGEAAAFPGLEDRRTPGGLEARADIKRSARMAEKGDPRTIERFVETETVNGRTSRYVFDSTTRELTGTTPEGRTETVETDAARRTRRIDHDRFATVVWNYDDTGRVESIVRGSGSDERRYSFTYDRGFVESITNPAGDTISLTRTGAEYVETITLPDDRTIGYTTTGEGLLSSVTSPGGSTYEYTYDGAGALDVITLPDGQTIEFERDADDAISSVTHPDGSTISWGYDSAGRVETVDVGRGTVETTWDANDRLDRVDGPDGVAIEFEFDGSLLTKRTWTGEVSGTVERTFDDSFRLDSRTVAGNTVSFDYDDDNLRTKAGDLDIVWNEQSALVDETTLASTTETWTHTPFGTVDTHSASAGGTTLYDADYTYDGRGLITELEETVEGSTTVREFEYDANGRVERVITDGTTTQEFGYDDDDNRDSHTRNGSTVSASYDDRNRLESYGNRSYEYDAAGRLEQVTEDGSTTTYDYDVEGSLRSVTKPDGTTVAYRYDGMGRRVAKLVDGTVTRKWLYRDGLSPVAELDADDDLVAQFVYGTRDYVPDYIIRNGTTYRIVTDHLGSPRLVVDASSGTVEQRIDYDVFGRVTTDTEPGFQPFGFAGGLYDPDTGLVSFGARDYDPETGRWTTPDPMHVAGGSFNRYTYVANCPQTLVDRSGLLLNNIANGFISGGAEAFMQGTTKGWSNIDWGQVGVSAGVGVMTGGAGKLLKAGNSLLKSAGVGSAGAIAEKLGKQWVKGECVTFSGLAQAGAIGGLTGGLGGRAGDEFKKEAAQIRKQVSNASDATTLRKMQPELVEHGGEGATAVTSKAAGKGIGDSINNATSSPSGASK